MRTVSVSETGMLMDCQRKHAFAYTGHLTGGVTLKPKTAALQLRRGRAWGAAVAAWHGTGDIDLAADVMAMSLDEDALEQEQAGVYLAHEHQELLGELYGMLAHYTATADRIALTDPERELHVPLPSRTGRRSSNRYAFIGYIDGLTREYEVPGLWIVEFKLRARLSSFEQAVWSRQIRWYTWAAQRQLKEPIAGVIVDERLAEVPKPPRILKSAKPSHAQAQLCTADAYMQACIDAGELWDQDTFDALAARRWQARHPVLLRTEEIERAGHELVSAAQSISEMDSGTRFPVANPSPMRCPGCAYKGICNRPTDDELIDVWFLRTTPKRYRPDEETQPMLALPTLVAA